MLIDLKFLCVVMRLFFILQHEADEKMAKVEDGLRPDFPIKSMVQQNNIMSNAVIFNSN